MFTRAERRQVKLKLAITGPSGSGKTTAALKLARGLTRNGRIAVIDTENRSASLYADLYDFDVLDLEPPFEHRKFIEGIQGAVTAGYDAVILDSASHFWEAILDYKDKLDRRGGNSFTNWAEASRQFRGILDSVLQSPIHVIACLRSKMDHVLEKDDRGRQAVRKVGMAPVMRDGVEYEFTVVLDLDMKHQAASSKDRTRMFDGRIFEVNEQTGEHLRQWLESGATAEPVGRPVEDDIPMDDTEAMASPGQCDELVALFKALAKTKGDLANALRWVGASDAKGFNDLTRPQADKLLGVLRKQAAAAQPDQNDAATNSDPLHVWFSEHEEQVNGYLVRVKWIKAGQTWRDLPEERVESIRAKQQRFASAAEVELKEGAA